MDSSGFRGFLGLDKFAFGSGRVNVTSLVLLGPQSDTIWQVAHSLGNIYYSETRELKAVVARGVASL